MDFGIYYTCYKETDAIENSLKVLYDIYPSIPVYMVSDGGQDYSYLEKNYKGLCCNLKNDVFGFVPTIDSLDYNSAEVQNKIVDAVTIFFERNMEAINYCQKPHMLIMEPDVLIRGKLSFPTGAKLLGSCVNSGLSEELQVVLSKIPGSISVRRWGAVPAIYDVEAFRKVYEFVINNRDIVASMVRAERRIANYDVALPVMFGACGFAESKNYELTECIRNPNWEFSKYPLLHQYRQYYGNTNYSGKWKK